MFNKNNYLVHILLSIYIKYVEPRIVHIVRLFNPHTNLNSPLVSVIIATYNRGDILVNRTLPSIISQTYQNFEIIIVGDNCEDDTEIMLAEKYGLERRVRFLNLKERGNYPEEVKNRWFVAGCVPGNKGLTLAKGDWIVWFDDDDLMASDYIESLLKFALEGNYEFVAGLYQEERFGEKVILGYKSLEVPEFGGHSTWMYRSYLKYLKYNINSWRKKWNKPADIDLQLRMLNSGIRMGSLEKVVSYVVPRPGLETVGLEAHLISKNK